MRYDEVMVMKKLHKLIKGIVRDKTVLVRVDYNVPLKKVGEKIQVVDDRRLQASLETLTLLHEANAKIILMSHLGRPKSKADLDLSLAPVAEHLQKLVSFPVSFSPDCVGPAATAAVEKLKPGEVLLLENLRFHPEEKQNDPNFAHQLACLAQIYVNDAFSNAHRAHASMVGVPQYLPAYAGCNFQKEVEALRKVKDNPEQPLVVVVGGAKISDKVDAIVNLTKIADIVLTGGGIANTFLKAQGLEIHKSYIQDAPADLKKKGIDYIHVAQDLLERTKTEKMWFNNYIPLPKILYPLDVIAAKSMDSTETKIIDLTHDMGDTTHDKSLMYLDIGPKTQQLYKEVLSMAKTIFWNGPMGVFEEKQFAAGTELIAHTLAKSPAVTVLGGGDTLASIEHLDLLDSFSYISTAGGAALEFLAGKELPALKPLIDSSSSNT